MLLRKPAENDFTVDVEGVGTFRFGRRTMRDQINIEVEYARIIDGTKATAWLQTVGGWLSDLRVLTVMAPKDWDIDNMNPLEDETYATLAKVHKALAAKEVEFRLRPKQASQAEGAGVGEDATVLVSPEVQPAP